MKRVCPKCGSDRIQKAGKVMMVSGEKQRVKCQGCGRVFYDTALVKPKPKKGRGVPLAPSTFVEED